VLLLVTTFWYETTRFGLDWLSFFRRFSMCSIYSRFLENAK
jgi:hypothetical protein